MTCRACRSCHIQRLDEYVDNVILFQLCLLVIQRLALTISPLKVHLLMTRKHVMKAIGVTVMASLIVDTLFAIFVTTTCQEVKERINYDSPQVVYRMCLALLLVFPFNLFNDHFPGSQNNERSISASDFPATTV